MTNLSIKADSFTLLNSDVLSLSVSKVVSSGTIVGLLGGNGSGKTTFLNSLLNAASDAKFSNTIFQFDEQPLISFVPQDPSTLLTPWLSIRKAFDIFSSNFDSLVQDVGQEMLDEKVMKLSGGQRQIVANHLALNRKHNVLLLDEPTSSMDEERKTIWMKALRTHVNDNKVICFISLHDLLAMRYLCDQVYVFNKTNKSIVGVNNVNKIAWDDYAQHKIDNEFTGKLKNGLH